MNSWTARLRSASICAIKPRELVLILRFLGVGHTPYMASNEAPAPIKSLGIFSSRDATGRQTAAMAQVHLLEGGPAGRRQGRSAMTPLQAVRRPREGCERQSDPG